MAIGKEKVNRDPNGACRWKRVEQINRPSNKLNYLGALTSKRKSLDVQIENQPENKRSKNPKYKDPQDISSSHEADYPPLKACTAESWKGITTKGSVDEEGEKRSTEKKDMGDDNTKRDGKCKGIVESIWKQEFMGNKVNATLMKIEKYGQSMREWNIKKRKEQRHNLRVKKDALARASSNGIPHSWIFIKNLEDQLDEVMEIEERYWKQRAKTDWLKGGDMNTHFFHSKASARRSRNMTRGLMDAEGVWRESNEEMIRITEQYFKNIFSSSKPTVEEMERVLVDVQPRLDSNTIKALDISFIEKEIREEFFDMNLIKASRSDGLPTI
ncbi:hypothetical protein Ddye_018615 [Dipteronia dyeriana]|uniref:Uncharacterized protein n=1 Tax=Dipteronia dyeriana TaxID=168575 RepID=A0AAD9UBD6_9ROSI|nr:hypothetical protein Ddye_018615 [Dipteronia dyeriana]